MTKEEILKKHLDKNGVEITKRFIGYLYDAMQEYSDLTNKSLLEENNNLHNEQNGFKDGIVFLKEENEGLKKRYHEKCEDAAITGGKLSAEVAKNEGWKSCEKIWNANDKTRAEQITQLQSQLSDKDKEIAELQALKGEKE